MHLALNVAQEIDSKRHRNVEDAFSAAFLVTDIKCQKALGDTAAGSTAVAVLVRLVGNKLWAVTANCGDARAVLCVNGSAVRLSCVRLHLRSERNRALLLTRPACYFDLTCSSHCMFDRLGWCGCEHGFVWVLALSSCVLARAVAFRITKHQMLRRCNASQRRAALCCAIVSLVCWPWLAALVTLPSRSSCPAPRTPPHEAWTPRYVVWLLAAAGCVDVDAW